MSLGFAYVDNTGFAYPNTVSSSERAAMVNALVSIFGLLVYNHQSDGEIKALFNQACPNGHGIRPVEITLVEVSDDDTA